MRIIILLLISLSSKSQYHEYEKKVHHYDSLARVYSDSCDRSMGVSDVRYAGYFNKYIGYLDSAIKYIRLMRKETLKVKNK